MLWGGIAGTLPDLDVLSGLVTDPMSALAYHRAFTHSLPFALLAAPIIGLTVHRIYGGRSGPRVPDLVFYPLVALLFWLFLVGGSALMPLEVYHLPAIAAVVTLTFAALCAAVGGWTAWRAKTADLRNPGVWQWTALFFAAIVTHPLLDCFTAYGTQFLEPFTRLRIAWDTVSVVDPLYTLPFLLLLLLAARKGAGTQVRGRLNTAGLLVSSLYLLLTVLNWFNVRAALRDTLQEEGLVSQRSVHSPTLGNNLLWSGTAQVGEDSFYLGQYSILDSSRVFRPFRPVPGHHYLLRSYHGDREVDILRWFTQGYYMVLPAGEGRVTVSDLRYGSIGSDVLSPDSYIFTWEVDTTVHPVRVLDRRPDLGREGGNMLATMWERMWGN